MKLLSRGLGGAALLLVATGCTTGTATTPDQTRTLDPLTCYIAGEGGTTGATSATLKCGGEIAATVDLGNGKGGADQDSELGNWTITRASVGTSDIGSSIIRVTAAGDDRSCTYRRDMADAAETTTRDCD